MCAPCSWTPSKPARSRYLAACAKPRIASSMSSCVAGWSPVAADAASAISAEGGPNYGKVSLMRGTHCGGLLTFFQIRLGEMTFCAMSLVHAFPGWLTCPTMSDP